MDRVAVKIDDLVRTGLIRDEVIFQAAALGYMPTRAQVASVVEWARLRHWMSVADAVVCHGGPGLILEALASGTSPLVIPRDPTLKEHVDDHQQRFVRWLAQRMPIIPIWDVNQLDELLVSDGRRSFRVASRTSSPTAAVRLHRIIEGEESP